MDTAPTVRDLILEHRLALQNEQKRLISEKEMAEIVGINDKYFNHIFNMRRKLSPKVTKVLADFFDDPRFYDAAGIKRPDKSLDLVNRNWWRLSERTKKKIDKLVVEDTGNEPRTQPRKKTTTAKP